MELTYVRYWAFTKGVLDKDVYGGGVGGSSEGSARYMARASIRGCDLRQERRSKRDGGKGKGGKAGWVGGERNGTAEVVLQKTNGVVQVDVDPILNSSAAIPVR